MHCIKCKRLTEPHTTSITYSRKESKITIRVDGIPADVCPICGEAYMTEEVAQQVFDIVNPILEMGKTMSLKPLPRPSVDIHFPPAESRLVAVG